jgi:hypothetical protein
MLLLVLGSLNANAKGSNSGFLIRPTAMYWSDAYNDGGRGSGNQTTKLSTTRIDLSASLGYLFEMGFFLGGTYFSSDESLKTEVGGSTTSEVKQTYQAYGPTIGWIGDMFYLLGTYHLSPVFTTGTDSQKITLSGSTGYQVDLGMLYWVHSQIAIGPQLTYYVANYTKQKGSNGVESALPSMANHTFIRPMLTFAFLF